MKHVMIDLETMGNTSDAAIVTIAALQFDLETGQTGSMYETHISLESCLNAGLSIVPSTLFWWLQQDQPARKELVSGQSKAMLLYSALVELAQFIHIVGEDAVVWGNSARFDLGILETAYRSCKLPLPWKFWNERCVRTLSELAPEIKRKMIFQGVAHHAIDDCHHQVRYTVATYRKLKGLPQQVPVPAPVLTEPDEDLPF